MLAKHVSKWESWGRQALPTSTKITLTMLTSVQVADVHLRAPVPGNRHAD